MKDKIYIPMWQVNSPLYISRQYFRLIDASQNIYEDLQNGEPDIIEPHELVRVMFSENSDSKLPDIVFPAQNSD